MSPVASRWEVPRKSVASGWVRVTSQPASLRSRGPRGSRGRRPRWLGRRAGRTTGPQVPRSASCSSTQIAAAGRRWVWRATRRACQAGTSSRTRVSRGAGGGGGGRGRRRSAVPRPTGTCPTPTRTVRGERRHQGCRRRPTTRRPGAPPHRTSRPRCRWWRGGGRPSARRAGACGTRRVVRPVRLRRRLRARRRGRGRRPRTPPGPWCSWDQVKHRPPTLEAENPLYPQGFRAS